MIIVEYGSSEFWRGPEEKISEIPNIQARIAAKRCIVDGKPQRVCMWCVRQEPESSESEAEDE